MRRLLAGTLAVAAVLGGIWAAQTWAVQKARLGAADNDDAVLAADQSLRRALSAGDKAAAAIHIDRRFVFVDRAGATFDRPQTVLGAGVPAGDEEADRRVQRYGRVAVIAGVARVANGASDIFFVHVWLKRRAGWRAIVYQDSTIAREIPVRAGSMLSAVAPACDNPCKTLPYRAKNVVEQDIMTAFQAIESAVAANDADAWARHIADEFMVYGAQAPARSKADRAAFIRAQQEARAVTRVGAVQSMQLWAFGDAAVMTAQQTSAEGRPLPYRTTRVWVRRDGHWQLALSQQTVIEH